MTERQSLGFADGVMMIGVDKMAKGTTAKTNVINKIAHAFGNDFIGEVDKKVYVWADDGGERVQIALALTCPKVQVNAPDGASAVDHGDWDFSDTPTTAAPAPVERAEVTAEEQARIEDMMSRLGL